MLPPASLGKRKVVANFSTKLGTYRRYRGAQSSILPVRPLGITDMSYSHSIVYNHSRSGPRETHRNHLKLILIHARCSKEIFHTRTGSLQFNNT